MKALAFLYLGEGAKKDIFSIPEDYLKLPTCIVR
jgi:hypothetical protein